MSGLPYLDILKGQVLTKYTHTWNTTYSKFLIRNDLHTLVGITETSPGLNVGAGSYTSNVVDFIQEFKYMPRTVLDGIARGNIKLRVYAYYDFYNQSDITTYAKVTPYLVAITSAGVERVLVTGATTGELSAAAIIGGPEVITIGVLPFFLDVNNQVILESERLLLRLDIQCKKVTTAGGTAAVSYMAAINTQDIFIELPVVL